MLLITASFLAFRRGRLCMAPALGLASILMSGGLMALAHRDGYSPDDVRALIARGRFALEEPVAFEGCVIKESELRGQMSVATVELLAFRHKEEWGLCRGKAVIRMADESGTRLFRRGDRVRGWATWSRPRNFENPGAMDTAGLLARRGVFVIGRIKSHRLIETVPGGCADPWTRIANAAAGRVHRSLEPLRRDRKNKSAAILASLVIGDYSGLDDSIREVFQNSGTFHVLVVSGLHVAWMAGVALQLFKWLRLPETIRYLLAFIVILFYTCVVGFQASITRCLWMFLLYLAGKTLFRRADAVNILFGSAVLLLVAQPDWLGETGFQLSFLSVLAIALNAAPFIQKTLRPLLGPCMACGRPDRLFLESGSWHRRGRRLRANAELCIEAACDALAPALSRILHACCRCLARLGFAAAGVVVSSLAVQLWIEPLLACGFNRISWVSPAANLFIVPFSSIVLASGLVAVSASGLPLAGPLLLRIAGSSASLLHDLAGMITAWDGTWQRCPTPSALWVTGLILLLFIWSFFAWRRFWIPGAAEGIVLGCLGGGSVPMAGTLMEKCKEAIDGRDKAAWERNASLLSLTFLDVGEGDSIVIRFPDMRIWVIDAGGLRQPPQTESAYGFDIGEAVVSRYLWHDWIGRIDRLLLTHPDVDHAGGIPAVMRNFRISRFEFAPASGDGSWTFADIAADRAIPIRLLQAPMEEKLGRVLIRVLNPSPAITLKSGNDKSLAIELSFGHFSAQLTGDLEKAGETALLSGAWARRSRLLKVAHHGSRSATSDSFLERIQPDWAVISVGRNNPYGHPSKPTLDRLTRHGARIFTTMHEGAITYTTDGRHYAIRSHIHGLLEHGFLGN